MFYLFIYFITKIVLMNFLSINFVNVIFFNSGMNKYINVKYELKEYFIFISKWVSYQGASTKLADKFIRNSFTLIFSP